ncbi:copper chaperone PCu(A)C [Streptomyces sp. MS06]|uniref:copper chaperone PCu(A)C n=1 Tax=Streptomyces sp. MS06 TaxID=3385974 RepID=UPI0039A385CF
MTSRNTRRPARLRKGGVRVRLTSVAVLLAGCTALAGCSSSPSAAGDPASPAASPSTSPAVEQPTTSPASPAPAGSVAYDEPVLQVTGAYIRQPVTTEMAAGYLTITNSGRLPDKLTGVTSDIAGMVTMHRTTAENQMEAVKAFPIPAGGSLTLRTGGNHLMLMNLKKKLTAGDTVTLQLRFGASDTMTLHVPVKPATYQPPN